ncbi:MAG: DNA mismatch repair protein MutS [Candidatus Absconditabacteria bacterium]|nr:DNA mismatch repair protein MutS [Candidatus Absconditabacteria bacterium]
MTTYTPAMQQYIDIKKQCTDCILFFRMGDFYETFFEDAKITSKILDLVLTSKNKNSENPIPMAGIPYHSVDKYIPKLISHGHKVAIAEQTTDPVPGKIVERKITQIITPGTFIQETKKTFTYMLAVGFEPVKSGYNFHIAWGDFALGEYWTKSFASIEDMQKFILIVNPVEIIVDIEFPDKDELTKLLKQYQNYLISISDVPHRYEEYLLEQCKIQTLSSYGKAVEEGRGQALALLFSYLQTTQQTALTNISRISLHSTEKTVLLDEVTLKNLEIFSSSYESSEKYSLIGILDTTKTSGGSRLLRSILSNPINDFDQLNTRLGHIEYYLNNEHDTHHIHNQLGNVSDIPKIMSNLLYRKLLASGFIRLRSTLRLFFEQNIMLDELIRVGLSQNTKNTIENFYHNLQKTIKDDEDFADDINFIRDGVDKEIDRLRDIAFHSDKLLVDYQQFLAEITGISNVKVKFILNQGYFIEITNKDIDQFETRLLEYKNNNSDDKKSDLVRRNTLKGGQRFTSPYLDNLQEEILEAKAQLVKQEFSRLAHLQQEMAMIVEPLTEFALQISWLDLFTSQALLAKQYNYKKPNITENNQIEIIEGRHPVIEHFLPQDQQFIPNTLNFGDHDDFLHVITGPNMGGKSTYLRQNALIILMAHSGLFVPAKEAKIGLIDALFARVGSGDVIAKNQSTFMTEMIEVANILNNATSKSFIIFDELGRGTSTYDGLALTKAILEYIVQEIKSKTLIATHYHELIQLEGTLPGVKNYSVSVYETDKEVVFMKKIAAGGASKSYGLDVAKLAGISPVIVERAKENLKALEDNKTLLSSPPKADNNLFVPTVAAKDPHYEKIKSLIESYDINSMTPLQALQLLAKIKEEL